MDSPNKPKRRKISCSSYRQEDVSSDDECESSNDTGSSNNTKGTNTSDDEYEDYDSQDMTLKVLSSNDFTSPQHSNEASDHSTAFNVPQLLNDSTASIEVDAPNIDISRLESSNAESNSSTSDSSSTVDNCFLKSSKFKDNEGSLSVETINELNLEEFHEAQHDSNVDQDEGATDISRVVSLNASSNSSSSDYSLTVDSCLLESCGFKDNEGFLSVESGNELNLEELHEAQHASNVDQDKGTADISRAVSLNASSYASFCDSSSTVNNLLLGRSEFFDNRCSSSAECGEPNFEKGIEAQHASNIHPNETAFGDISVSDVSEISSIVNESDESSDKVSDVSDEPDSDSSDESVNTIIESDESIHDGSEVLESIDSQPKLHSTMSITKDEAILRILKIYFDNKCSKKCLRDIISTFCDLLPEGHDLPRSSFLFFKHLENLAPEVTVTTQHYCSQCFYYFGETMVPECPVCHAVEKVGRFYEFDVVSCVKYYFEKRDLCSIIDSQTNLEHQSVNGICDITDGISYKNINSQREKYDLTLLLNTDGVKLKKSSASDVWLLMFMPVEVPIHLRERFITIIGVWNDCRQPNMNTFLQPLCLKLRECVENGGVSWRHPQSGKIIASKIVAPLFIADAPARAKIQNLTNFNGRYGCNLCEVKTVKTTPIQGKKRTRVYARNFDAPLRECRRMRAQAHQAVQEGGIIKGVKGPSVMSILSYIDIASMLIPEFMHSVLLGVVRQLMYLWFASVGPFSCKAYIENINIFLNSIRPPSFFQRMPRNLSTLKLWKAAEFYNWLLFYSVPAMKPFLPEQYFQHYLLLVRSLFILLQEKITEAEIFQSEQLLRLFVEDMENLYGERAMTYNVHQLLHLGLTVRRWGPLFATSAFPFENMNGLVSKTTHGNINIAQEIVCNVKYAFGYKSLLYKVHDQVNSKSFCEVLGRKVPLALKAEENICLQSAGITNVSYGFTRARIGRQVFTSVLYKDTRTADFYVSWKNINGVLLYGIIRFFVCDVDNNIFMLVERLQINHVEVIYHAETRKSVKHLLPFKVTSDCTLVHVNDDFKLTKEIVVGNYICKRPNSHFQVM